MRSGLQLQLPLPTECKYIVPKLFTAHTRLGLVPQLLCLDCQSSSCLCLDAPPRSDQKGDGKIEIKISHLHSPVNRVDAGLGRPPI